MSSQPINTTRLAKEREKHKKIYNRHRRIVDELVERRDQDRIDGKEIPEDSINTDQLEELIELKCDCESDLKIANAIRSNLKMDKDFFGNRDIMDKDIRDIEEKIKKLNDVLELGNPITTVDEFNHRLNELYTSEFHTDPASVTQPDVSDPKENTEKRNARLQDRFNELYKKMKNKEAACKTLSKEEDNRSGITKERLMKIMRV